MARNGPSTKLFAISPHFTQVTSWGSSGGNGSASPRGTGPASKGETLIQSDCSFGNFLPLKEQNEQKLFSSGKKKQHNKTQHGNKAQISTRPRNGSRHGPCHSCTDRRQIVSGQCGTTQGEQRGRGGCDGEGIFYLISPK